MSRSSKNYDPNRDFWEKERRADLTPAKSLDDMSYINVPVEELPLDITTDSPEISEMQENIRVLADKKILNFTGISNTDLKLTYGAANINFLITCDMNYTRLVQNIARLAEAYLNLGLKSEARQLFEYGISIGTDVKKNYLLLADIYTDSGESSKISGLLETARTLNSLSKDSIISALESAVQNA
ncbi:MAG: hypothetical protein IJ805_08080 [Lachnospiraceae bacterium]|nr:hypothetical protein [Lachnospiraceae bacterium]